MIHDRKVRAKNSRRTLRGAAVLVLLLGVGVLASRPASACKSYEICPGDVTYDPSNAWMQQLAEQTSDAGNTAKDTAYTSMISLFSKMTSYADELMDKAGLKYNNNLEAQLNSDNLAGRVGIMETNAQIWANTHDEAAAMAGESALHSGVNAGGADQFLCNVIKVRQGIPDMEQFSRMVARIGAVGIDATYVLGQGGPKYWVDDLLMRCGQVKGFELKTANSLDGVPAACRAPISLPGQGSADLDINADLAVARDRVYTLPPVKQVDYTVNGITQKVSMFVPESEDEQVKLSMQRWMQASQFCYLAPGYRPPPPRGKAQWSPIGAAKNDKVVECRAKQELFTTRCMYRLARLTRPNCADPAMAAFCLTAQDACAAAKTANLPLDPSYKHCMNGLSLEQLETVSAMLCGATSRIQSAVLSGETEADKLKILTHCAHLKSQWKDKQDREDAAFRRALEGLQDMPDCFAKADQM